MRFFYILLLAISLFATSVGFVFAGGPGTSAASFLKIGMGARPVGMGGVFCAIADDVNAIQYNPAGLMQLKRKEVLTSHNEWIEGIRSEFLGYAQPLNNNWAFALALNYLYMDGLIKRDIAGNDLKEEFGANSGVAVIALSRKIQNVSFGVNAKAIQEKIESRTATAYAFDIGGMYKFGNLKVGAVTQNIGTKMKLYEEEFPLPLNFKLGVAYSLFENLNLGIDINKPNDNDINTHIGSEYWIANTLALRAGYQSKKDTNAGTGISAGVGLRFWSIGMDYAWSPAGDLGSTQLFSIAARFGNSEKKTEIATPIAVEKPAAPVVTQATPIAEPGIIQPVSLTAEGNNTPPVSVSSDTTPIYEAALSQQGTLLTTDLQKAAQPNIEKTGLTNSRIIALTKAGTSDTTIISLISQFPSTGFDTSLTALIELHDAGVSSAVIDAIKRSAEKSGI